MRKPSLLLAFAAAASLFVAAAQSSRRLGTLPSRAGTSQSQTDHSTWEGSYNFQEGGGRTKGSAGEFVEHTIVIRRRGEELIADIDADGFQTSRSLRCSAKAEGDKLSIYFQSYREGNVFTPYQKGQLMLTLEKTTVKGKVRLLTRWGAYEPALDAPHSGKAYFRKVG
jgi:hypothetical protein